MLAFRYRGQSFQLDWSTIRDALQMVDYQNERNVFLVIGTYAVSHEVSLRNDVVFLEDAKFQVRIESSSWRTSVIRRQSKTGWCCVEHIGQQDGYDFLILDFGRFLDWKIKNNSST